MRQEVKFNLVINGGVFIFEDDYYMRIKPDGDVPYDAVCLTGKDRGTLYAFYPDVKVLSISGDFEFVDSLEK